MTAPPAPGEQGYAMVAAVAAMVVFALLALALQAEGRGRVAEADAELTSARLAAAADAGLALALAGVVAQGPAGHWLPDGRPRQLGFAGSRLAVRIEDEHGKIPISLLDEQQAEHLLAQAGLAGERLQIARDSLLDWTDEDDEARPMGAERAYYAPRHIAPRNGPLRSIDELALVRGFDPALVERLRPVVTVDWDNGAFEPRFASAEALAVMTEGDDDTPAIIARKRELAGQVTAFAFAGNESLAGHLLRIVVEASGGGGRVQRVWIVQITGNSARPYEIRTAL